MIKFTVNENESKILKDAIYANYPTVLNISANKLVTSMSTLQMLYQNKNRTHTQKKKIPLIKSTHLNYYCWRSAIVTVDVGLADVVLMV